MLALAACAIVLLLARLVQRNLQLARAAVVERRLAEQIDLERHHLRNVVEASQAGSREWNVATDEWTIDRRWAAMLGHEEGSTPGQRRADWRDLVHPDDLGEVDAALARLLDGK